MTLLTDLDINKYKEGDLFYAPKLGYKRQGYIKFVSCPRCGKLKFAYAHKNGTLENHETNPYCRSCIQIVNNEKLGFQNHARYKAAKMKDSHGYISITIDKNDSYVSMCRHSKRGHIISEHRYVMAKSLGRCLKTHEVVHHLPFTILQNRIKYLENVLKENNIQYD